MENTRIGSSQAESDYAERLLERINRYQYQSGVESHPDSFGQYALQSNIRNVRKMVIPTANLITVESELRGLNQTRTKADTTIRPITAIQPLPVIHSSKFLDMNRVVLEPRTDLSQANAVRMDPKLFLQTPADTLARNSVKGVNSRWKD